MKVGDRIVPITTKPLTATGGTGTGAKKVVGGAATAASSVKPAVIAAQLPQAFTLAAPLQVEIMTNVAVR